MLDAHSKDKCEVTVLSMVMSHHVKERIQLTNERVSNHFREWNCTGLC